MSCVLRFVLSYVIFKHLFIHKLILFFCWGLIPWSLNPQQTVINRSCSFVSNESPLHVGLKENGHWCAVVVQKQLKQHKHYDSILILICCAFFSSAACFHSPAWHVCLPLLAHTVFLMENKQRRAYNNYIPTIHGQVRVFTLQPLIKKQLLSLSHSLFAWLEGTRKKRPVFRR